MSLISASDCTSKQTFCGLNAETIEEMMEQDEEFNEQINTIPLFIQNSIITTDIYNKIKEILQYINEYGNEGTRNPTIEEINTISNNNQNDIIYYNNYNNILNILNIDNLISSGETIISASLINSLKDYIKAYKFNEDRCNYCNVSNNCSQGGGGCGEACSCGNQGGGGCTAGSECMYGQGDGPCEYLCQSQSARIYKENIQDYTEKALNIINATKIVKFNYITDLDKNQKIGFIADDTDAQLATKNHNVMDMYNCIGILLKAVQELSTELEELKKQIN